MPSFDQPVDRNIAPSPWIERFADLVQRSGRVLDLAAGHGRHTTFFLERGLQVVATDIDTSALRALATGGLSIIEADLEDGPWPFGDEKFDAIVVSNYLHRPHFPLLTAALADKGILLFDTFGKGNETVGRPRNPDFLLAPGELLDAFGQKLRIVAYEHGKEDRPRPAVRQRLCAIKMEAANAINRLL